MSEMEISFFPAPAVGWLTLRLDTTGCHIFGWLTLCSSTKLPTTLLKFMIACSTGDEDGGGRG